MTTYEIMVYAPGAPPRTEHWERAKRTCIPFERGRGDATGDVRHGAH